MNHRLRVRREAVPMQDHVRPTLPQPSAVRTAVWLRVVLAGAALFLPTGLPGAGAFAQTAGIETPTPVGSDAPAAAWRVIVDPSGPRVSTSEACFALFGGRCNVDPEIQRVAVQQSAAQARSAEAAADALLAAGLAVLPPPPLVQELSSLATSGPPVGAPGGRPLRIQPLPRQQVSTTEPIDATGTGRAPVRVPDLFTPPPAPIYTPTGRPPTQGDGARVDPADALAALAPRPSAVAAPVQVDTNATGSTGTAGATGAAGRATVTASPGAATGQATGTATAGTGTARAQPAGATQSTAAGSSAAGRDPTIPVGRVANPTTPPTPPATDTVTVTARTGVSEIDALVEALRSAGLGEQLTPTIRPDTPGVVLVAPQVSVPERAPPRAGTQPTRPTAQPTRPAAQPARPAAQPGVQPTASPVQQSEPTRVAAPQARPAAPPVEQNRSGDGTAPATRPQPQIRLQ